MSENEMLNKKETLEEALGEEIEAVKGTVEEAAENAPKHNLESHPISAFSFACMATPEQTNSLRSGATAIALFPRIPER